MYISKYVVKGGEVILSDSFCEVERCPGLPGIVRPGAIAGQDGASSQVIGRES
jgi:hypothetical protein